MEWKNKACNKDMRIYFKTMEQNPEFNLLIRMVFAMTKEFLHYVESKYTGTFNQHK